MKGDVRIYVFSPHNRKNLSIATLRISKVKKGCRVGEKVSDDADTDILTSVDAKEETQKR